MFLICSGYGLNESYNKVGLKNYWFKRVKSVFLLYFIIQTIIDLYKLQNGLTLKSYILDILIFNTTHPLGWYLQYLMIWYVIFYFANKIKIKFEIRIGIYMFISLVMLVFFKDSLWSEQSFSFTIGIALSSYKAINISKSKYAPLFLFSIGLLCLSLKQIDIVRNLPYICVNVNQLLIKLPLAMWAILFTFRSQSYISFKQFSILGSFSYEIYLVHGYSLKILDTVTYSNIIIFLIITILISMFFKQSIKLMFKFGKVVNNDYLLTK